MQENLFLETPPKLYLKQVANHCPKAMSTYLDIWDKKNKQNQLHVYKEDLKSDFLTSLTKFRNDLLHLVKEGLISMKETKKVIHVDITGWDNDFDEFC